MRGTGSNLLELLYVRAVEVLLLSLFQCVLHATGSNQPFKILILLREQWAAEFQSCKVYPIVLKDSCLMSIYVKPAAREM